VTKFGTVSSGPVPKEEIFIARLHTPNKVGQGTIRPPFFDAAYAHIEETNVARTLN